MSVTAAPSPLRQRSPRRVLAVTELWTDGLRIAPVLTIVVSGAVGCAWAAATGLDSTADETLLCVIASIALGVVLSDPAAELTAPTVLPLAWRRAVPAALGMAMTTAAWLAGRVAAVAVDAAPWPGGFATLEWAVIASSQLAIGAVLTRGRAGAPSFGPALMVALLWFMALREPHLHTWLYDPAVRSWRWVGLLVGFAAVAYASSLDPARRLGAPRG